MHRSSEDTWANLRKLATSVPAARKSMGLAWGVLSRNRSRISYAAWLNTVEHLAGLLEEIDYECGGDGNDPPDWVFTLIVPIEEANTNAPLE